MPASRIFLAFFIIWGALIFWLAPHPPMVDFPQHAAQVKLLRDMVAGVSPWSSMLQINLVTPYLIGYGSAFLLSYLMPIASALKLLLSVAYVAFVLLCITMRKRVNGDPRLDWLFIPTYFGLCYSWGLLTFLLAAPVGILFMLQADKYNTAPTTKRAVWVILAGLFLLISHGMTFVLGWGVGIFLLAVRSPKRLSSIRLAWPYLVLLAAGYIFYETGKQIDATLIQKPHDLYFGHGLYQRFKDALQFPFSFGFEIKSHEALIPVVIAIGAAPLLLGSRIEWRNPAVWVPFLSVCILFFGLPDTADNTALLFQRFSLFLLPTFIWLFSPRNVVAPVRTQPHSLSVGAPQERAPSASTTAGAWTRAMPARAAVAVTLMIGCCVFILGSASMHAWSFGQETKNFDRKVLGLQPNQRALGLMFDDGSVVADSSVVYVHYPAWYQAEKSGLTDFNFAWYTPQIVRYRSGASPPVSIGFEWKPETLDWTAHHAETYKYFFVRGKKQPDVVFKTFPCMPKPVIQEGLWTVYENCAPGAADSQVATAR